MWDEFAAGRDAVMHVLPHQLGHHHDRMTTPTQRYAARGEPYAEEYANRVLDDVWPAYISGFAI
jgi:hypothetical protein